MTLHKIESANQGLTRLLLCCVLFAGFFLTLAMPGISVAQINKEYFVRQEADEALLIRISGYEAEIESRVQTAEHLLLLSSAMPQSRLVPIFQFIESSSKPRQLELDVSLTHSTANSKVDIEFTRLAAWDQRSAELERAYRLLSFGMQSGNAGSAADWSVRINSLMSAGTTFGRYGMQELRLWSSYLAVHLVQYRLHDYNLVLALTREILADTRDSRWQDIELACLQLRSAALIGLRRTGKLRNPNSDTDLVQTALHLTAQRADAMGQRFENAQAIMQSALEYEDQSAYPMALEQFQLALEIVDSIGEETLAKGIRESIANIHAGQGNDPATSKVLQEIETKLAAGGGGDELALNLLQQGRIYIRNFNYPKAIEVLSQAQGFENDSSIRSQINLELARAHFETGQNNDSLAYLESAGMSRQQAATYFRQSFLSQMSDSQGSGQRATAEARYQKAQSLARNGRRSEAVEILENLIDSVSKIRQSQRGVLGAWYWARHEQLIDDYLALQMVGSRQGGKAGFESLLTLNKIRHSQLPVNAVGVEKQTGSKSSLANFMTAMANDEAILTFHLTPSVAYVWLGRDGEVRQFKIPNPEKLFADVQAARGYLEESDGASLGPHAPGIAPSLLGPVATLLPAKIYLISSGELVGFPFDALRLNDRYLAEQYTITNLLQIPLKPNLQDSLRFTPPEQIFLAGHPQVFSGSFATQLETSEEVQAVADIFIGPGLHIIQGPALLPDEFQVDRFASADLAHLSMPASIDLGHPEQSHLELSEAVRDFGWSAFRQADIRRLNLGTGLVFLSASHVVGLPRSSVSTQAGVASAFLDAGARATIAGLWRGDGGDGLVTDFYHNLATTQDIALALVAAKRQKIGKNKPSQTIEWARYQLFIH